MFGQIVFKMSLAGRFFQNLLQNFDNSFAIVNQHIPFHYQIMYLFHLSH